MARFHVKNNKIFILAILFITLFQLWGMSHIYLETDFTKMMPTDIPAVVLKNRITDTFSGQDMVFLLVEIDPSSSSENRVEDIRDPRVMQMLVDLSDELLQESAVDSVQSVGLAFQGREVPNDIDGVKNVFSKIEGSGGFFNRDFTSTTVLISSNVGTGTEKIKDMLDTINEDIEDTPKPPGVNIQATGMPTIRVLIADILIKDSQYTIMLASLIILILLLIVQKSVTRGLLVFNPLFFALIWTLGTMGWLDIPLSMVTAGVGAMILGLGVEYSVFFVNKFNMEREKGESQEDSIYIALDEVGTAIIGSSTTTIIGFLALLFSMMPMMHDLGKTLALGIFFCVIGSLGINPSFLVFEENTYKKFVHKMVCEQENQEENK